MIYFVPDTKILCLKCNVEGWVVKALDDSIKRPICIICNKCGWIEKAPANINDTFRMEWDKIDKFHLGENK